MKLLVISLAGNGDTLFATPLIHELRANFPAAQIDVLVRWRAAQELLDGNPHVNTVHQRDLMSAGKIESLKFLRQLRRERYDISFNTHPQSRIHYRLISRIVAARLRASHEYECSGPLDKLLVNRSLPQDYTRHAIHNNLALLGLVCAKPVLPRHDYEIFPPPAETEIAARFFAEKKLLGRALLGVHIGSGGTKNLALRRWPLENYLALFRQLQETRPELSILLFGGPDEKADHEIILAQPGLQHVAVAPTKNLRQAAAFLKHCSSFLSVDTALMHMAAAVKVPRQFVIETPTWNPPIEPFNQPFTLIKNPCVAGRNLEFYRYDGEPIRGSREEILRCMASVSVADVLAALLA